MLTRILPINSAMEGRHFINAYVTTMRPYLLFVSGITGVVGMSFVPGIGMRQFVPVFIASFLSYGFGQALTDCFQIDTDALSAPYRPLTRGVISKRDVFMISVARLLLCISIFAMYNYLNIFLGMVSGVGLYTYTRMKKKWWAGPFYNAIIVAVLCMMALFTGFKGAITEISIICTLAVVFFGYANFVLAGYFKDIRADRATNYNTFPVVYGARRASFVSDVFALLTVMSFVVVFSQGWETVTGQMARLLSILFAVSGIGILFLAQFKLHSVTRDEEAHGAISLVVHSYILLLSGIACLQKPEWAVFLIVFYGAFIAVFKLRPVEQQI